MLLSDFKYEKNWYNSTWKNKRKMGEKITSETKETDIQSAISPLSQPCWHVWWIGIPCHGILKHSSGLNQGKKLKKEYQLNQFITWFLSLISKHMAPRELQWRSHRLKIDFTDMLSCHLFYMPSQFLLKKKVQSLPNHFIHP